MSQMKTNRRRFLKTAGAVASASLLPQGVSANGSADDRPNIIFVFADQLRADILGCYGGRQIATPHFDRLASEGARFENAISTYPVCSPYRAMLLTGMMPMRNGTVGNDTAPKDDLPSIAEACKEQGYNTAYIGKWHLEWDRTPFVPQDRRRGFDYWAVYNCSHRYFGAKYFTDTDEPLTYEEEFEPMGQTRLAVEYINERKDDGPFCMFMSWGPPHDPYHAPEDYMNDVDPDAIEFPPNAEERAIVDELLATDETPMSEAMVKARAGRRKRLEDESKVRQDLQGYYAATKSIDDCMGTLLAALDEAGIADNTIIAFSSDHGDMLGTHHMISKQCPLEESVRIPFMIRYPKRIPEGVEADALLAPIDVMPTLLSLAGLGCPTGIDGLDLSEAAEGTNDDQRDALLTMKLVPGGNPWISNAMRPWRGVRTKRYTYARRLDLGPWLLFDNETDPGQMNNLVADPAYAALVEEMERRLDALLAEADDPCDTEAILAYREERKSAGR